MEEVIRIQDQYYILASSSRADERTQVLKHSDTFGVFDHFGNVLPLGLREQGLYHEGTRFLSRLDLRIGGRRPLLLSSTVRDENDILTVDLTNPDLHLDGEVFLPRGTLHIFRSKFLWMGVCYERIRVQNHGLESLDLMASLSFDADFADIFEVRGVKRPRRGEILPALVEGGVVNLRYLGLDGVERRTRLDFGPKPLELEPGEARFAVRLPSKGTATRFIAIACETGEDPPRRLPYEAAYERASGALARRKARLAKVRTSCEPCNDWLDRSVADTHMMITDTRHGSYPYAGVPWYSTPFGRDGILTALQLLWVDPQVARGVLGFLAAHQARHDDPEEDAEPGKILHEMRRGEMAAMKEIPFGKYYGSVDATPLFVLLAGAYHERTGDRAFIETIWKNILLALEWIDRHGDRDGDGFVEYSRRSPRGLLHQGWKDSQDSVFHSDGELAQGPIALCEVQGYVYAARRKAAALAALLGEAELSARLLRQADELRRRFEEVFWCEELSTYALALDGAKRPCRVRTSNPGHCLFTGICDPERARRTGRTLLDRASFSGWGIRTVSAGEVRYNPVSYHNGSVWPHDNAIIAYGLARSGMGDLALRVMDSLLEAAGSVELHRLPELVCGFPRRPGEGPTLYPVACAPQAWSAGAVFLFLEAVLGLSIRAPERQVVFTHPQLPEALKSVEIRGLAVGSAAVDLHLERHRASVSINVLRKVGNLGVVVVN